MAKNKKKRNKSYKGKDAAVTKPIVTKIKAQNRSKFGDWWLINKKRIKFGFQFLSISLFIVLIIIEIVRLFN